MHELFSCFKMYLDSQTFKYLNASTRLEPSLQDQSSGKKKKIMDLESIAIHYNKHKVTPPNKVCGELFLLQDEVEKQNCG